MTRTHFNRSLPLPLPRQPVFLIVVIGVAVLTIYPLSAKVALPSASTLSSAGRIRRITGKSCYRPLYPAALATPCFGFLYSLLILKQQSPLEDWKRRQSFFLCDPVRPVGSVEDVEGVNDARPSVLYTPRRRVHRVRPWPPSTSNNHRCTVGRQFVRSDEHL